MLTRYRGIYQEGKRYYFTARYNKRNSSISFNSFSLAVKAKIQYDLLKKKIKQEENFTHNKLLGIRVSKEDEYLIKDFRVLSINKNNRYPITYTRNKKGIALHKLILVDQTKRVDHIDRDTLNNERSNLRYCTASQNSQNTKLSVSNTSGYKGVTFEKKSKKWVAQVGFKRKTIKIGRYRTKEEAVLARQTKAKELFGGFYSD